MANPSRYRYINFYGGRILQAREVADLQRIQEGLDSGGVNRLAFDLDALYREGASFNITSSIAANIVTISATNSSLPMYVFVRGRWEVLQPSEIDTTLILAGAGNIYLNWVIRQVTSAEDSTLVDTNTGEPTADMGELDLVVSTSDTSGVSLTGTQFEKNTLPIILFTYNGAQVNVPIDNINSIALANSKTSGLVSLTTDTSAGKGVASDDLRLSDGRNPLTGSVIDNSVRIPVAVSPAATNSDGTPVYNLSSDVGGIDSKKIVHTNGSQLVSDVIEWIKGQVANLTSIFSSHIGARLGLNTTHPMPSAADVGATPASHVGMALGLPGSHPASVTANSGGFSLNRDSSVAPLSNDPAYGLFSSGTLQSALLHNGDLFSLLANAVTASPVGTTTTGSLGLFTTVAKVLSEHVNQTSHSNPHGLSAGDLGAATTSYVDTAVANILTAAENYTNNVVPTVTLRTVSVTLPSNIYVGYGNQLLPGTPGIGANTGTYLIIRYSPNSLSSNAAVEIAIGTGTANHGDTIPLPTNDFSYSNWLGAISPAIVGYAPRTINQFVCQLQNAQASGEAGTIRNIVHFHVNDNNGTVDHGMVNWFAMAWRTNV